MARFKSILFFDTRHRIIESIMLNKRFHSALRSTLLLAVGFLAAFACGAQQVDRIVAVVEDSVVLESELNRQVASVKGRLATSNTPLPGDDIIRRQVLERLIIDKLQRQLAERSNIRIDDQTLHNSMVEIAQRNNLRLEEFRQALQAEGIRYENFVEEMRNELIIRRLRDQFITSQVKVSDREVEHYLETQDQPEGGRNVQYQVGHILIATPDGASPSQIQDAREKAERIIAELKKESDFSQMAIRHSSGAQALTGGDLGWRTLGQIPSLLADKVVHMQEGAIEGPIHSPSGFHIIKLLGLKGSGGKHIVTETQVRHILLKTSELFNDEDARNRLLDYKKRIEEGADFAALARAHSDDKGSGLKGGDLGWVTPGTLVPAFEAAMNALTIDQLSEPVQTQFGWHLIQVLGRRERDDTSEHKKAQAREAIRQRKIEEETELWLRRLRSEAYVEIRLGG